MFFDLKFKSLFYKNDRKQPDLWSFFITFVAESSGLAIFWSWILTSFLADRSQNWSICIKIQIKLRYSVQKSSRSVCREARNLKNILLGRHQTQRWGFAREWLFPNKRPSIILIQLTRTLSWPLPLALIGKKVEETKLSQLMKTEGQAVELS